MLRLEESDATQAKGVLAVENWMGTACVLETASRRLSLRRRAPGFDE